MNTPVADFPGDKMGGLTLVIWQQGRVSLHFIFVVTFAVPLWILVALFVLYLVVSRVVAKHRRPPK
jgi:hypothetical protein